MSDDELSPAQRRAKALRQNLQSRREEQGFIAGTPGTLGDANTNNSTGGDVVGPMKTLGLDDKPPR